MTDLGTLVYAVPNYIPKNSALLFERWKPMCTFPLQLFSDMVPISATLFAIPTITFLLVFHRRRIDVMKVGFHVHQDIHYFRRVIPPTDSRSRKKLRHSL